MIDETVLEIVAFVALGIALVALGWAIAVGSSVRRIRHDLVLLQGPDGTDSFVDVVARKTEEVNAMRGEVDDLAILVDRLRTELSDALRHVSVVRYDAFGDLGGRLSFSAALLDDGGDGLVFTSIHGRTETRSYVKGIKAGAGGTTLSPEERQAVSYALRGAPA